MMGITLFRVKIRRPLLAGCRNFKAVYCSTLQASSLLFFDTSIGQVRNNKLPLNAEI
jgi:hypothetical protein